MLPCHLAEHLLTLCVDPRGLHRRRVWECWEQTDGRTGRWGALLSLGVTLRAADITTLELERDTGRDDRSQTAAATSGGSTTWKAQYPLADRWTLLVLDRRGFGESPPADGDDFEVDARDIAEALGDGAHLVAHSYGGVGALLAAAARPQAVHSWRVPVTESTRI